MILFRAFKVFGLVLHHMESLYSWPWFLFSLIGSAICCMTFYLKRRKGLLSSKNTFL